MPDISVSFPFSFPGSNLREKFSRAILELIESGGLQQLKEKWWQKDEDCIDVSVYSTQ